MKSLSRSRSLALVPTIAMVTLRQLLGRRRALLLLLLAAVPVALAAFMRLAGVDDVEALAGGLLDRLIIALILPIAAVLFGTGAFGAEIEDGTVVYLLAKPIARWAIIVGKLVAVTIATLALVLPSVALSSLIGIVWLGDTATRLAETYFLAAVVGTVLYVSFFIALSLFTRRALLIGFCYLLVWEGTLSSLLPGIANLSIRQYALGVGQVISDIPTGWGANLHPGTAVPLSIIALVAALAIATWKLMRFELPGGTD